MTLLQFEISNFRNILAARLECNSLFNLFYGRNGAGKTSLLEAIYYLALGRSFRSNYTKRVITNEHSHATLFARLQTADAVILPLGMELVIDGKKRLRMDGKEIQSQSEIVKQLPLQIINTNSYRMLEMGPKYRRQFLDWGLFHVKPEFFPLWQAAQRLLQQRNAALRNHMPCHQLQLWDSEFVTASNSLHELRRDYIQSFTPLFQELFTSLLPELELTLGYYPGWDTTKELAQQLQQHYQQDSRLGYTSIGPQRADLRCIINGTPAQDLLSRGQQKLLICALQLAQGIHLKQQTNNNCLYLVDDLPSELDAEKRKRVLGVLTNMHTQVFISGIEKSTLTANIPENIVTLFHVKQGQIM